MKKISISPLLAALLLSGCMAEVVDAPPRQQPTVPAVATVPEEAVAIGVTMGMEDFREDTDSAAGAATRTTSTTLLASQFASGDQIYCYFPSNVTVGSTSSACNTTFTKDANGNTATAATTPYMNSGITTATFHAYYPSTVTNATTTFSVNLDQTGDADYKASDLMYATETVTKTTADYVTGNLSFTHQMSKILVTATADTGKGVTAVTGVRLIGGKRTCTIANGQPNTSGTYSNALSNASGNGIKLYDNSTGAATVSCAGIIPPQTIAANTAFLEVTVTTDGGLTGTATYAIPSGGKTFETGNAYTLTITVNLASIGVTTAISGWGNGGSSTLNNSGTTTLTAQ